MTRPQLHREAREPCSIASTICTALGHGFGHSLCPPYWSRLDGPGDDGARALRESRMLGLEQRFGVGPTSHQRILAEFNHIPLEPLSRICYRVHAQARRWRLPILFASFASFTGSRD